MQAEPAIATEPSGVSLIYSLPSIVERLHLNEIFAKPQPLEVELGSGDGSFLVNYALRHTEHNFIGVERLLGRIRKMDKKARRAGLANLRGIRIESAYFLEYLLPRHSATALHIYFPDPWPKRKHWRHRLISEGFPALAYQALVGKGTVFVRTDDANYFQQIMAVFSADSRFQKVETPQELGEFLTDFEREFQAKGIKTLRTAFTKL